MGKMKKAVIFSLISVFMVLLFTLSFKISSDANEGISRMRSARYRIELLNSLISDLDDHYFQQMLEVSAKEAIGSISKYGAIDIENKVRFNNKDKLIKEIECVMMDGTLTDGTELYNPDFNSYPFDPNNHAFPALVGHLEDEYSHIGININELDIHISGLTQLTYDKMILNITVSYHFSDRDNLASWKGNTDQKIEVSIWGLYDPISPDMIIRGDWVEDIDENGKLCSTVIDSDCKSGSGSYSCTLSTSYLNRLMGKSNPHIGDIGVGLCKASEECDKLC